MKSRIYKLIAFLILGVSINGTLMLLSHKTNERKNGFVRKFMPLKIFYMHWVNIGYNSFYIAGITNRYVYLGNNNAPLLILMAKDSFFTTKSIFLKKPGVGEIDWQSVRLHVDSPDVYLEEGNSPRVLLTDIGEQTGWKNYSFHAPRFTKAIPISSNTFILRTYDFPLHKNILTRISLDSPYLKLQRNALRKQIDGFFCTDGQLLFDKSLQKVIYLYYYRNQFVCMDTTLAVLYYGKTIDTNSKAKITVDSAAHQRLKTISTPPLTVNKESCTFNGLLFVRSNLKADNEDKKQFESATVLDVYTLLNGQYHRSLYIPNFRNLEATDFIFSKNRITALYDHYLVTYEINDFSF
jgi:hypothetical protein